MKRLLCLGLFLLPLLGMLITLLNQDKEIEKEVVIEKVMPIVEEPIVEVKKEVPIENEWLDDSGIKYKQANRFETCGNIDTLIKQGFGDDILQASTTVTRIDFLEALLKVHCIDYSNADISSIAFTDINNDDSETKKIIQKSIEIGIANGSEENGKKVFKAHTEITKIEALAILRKISGLELKDNSMKNRFTDLDVNWKRKVANMANILGLVPVDAKNKLFHPNEIVTNKTLSAMLGNILKYYR
ncbi:hypothetical protein LR004_03210 [Candidatus Gracilibacteria bacterium]|nr:hypothetical protein [Candidatus Gracilibacteria bacterium]